MFGDRHLDTAGSQRKLALLWSAVGEFVIAEELLEKAETTYSVLQDEAGAAKVRQAKKQVSLHRAQQTEGRLGRADGPPVSTGGL